jgi:hypothetical protein
VFFSDAVIAMTLLALELRIPEGDSDAALWRSFLRLLAAVRIRVPLVPAAAQGREHRLSETGQ